MIFADATFWTSLTNLVIAVKEVVEPIMAVAAAVLAVIAAFKSKTAVKVAEVASIRTAENRAAIHVVAQKVDVVHEAVSKIDAFRMETAAARQSAEARLEQIRGGER